MNNRVKKTRRFFKKINQFNYMDTEGINPLIRWVGDGSPSEAAHDDLSRTYSQKHQSGDRRAIFTYVKADSWSFKAPWVGDQIAQWRENNDKEKIKRVFSAFLDDRGQKVRGRKSKLLWTIKRDQKIFRCVADEWIGGRTLEYGDESCFSKVARKYKLTAFAVKKVWHNYSARIFGCIVREANTPDDDLKKWRSRDNEACRKKLLKKHLSKAMTWFEAMNKNISKARL